MNKKEIKVGMRVIDTWYKNEFGVGTIVKVLKTRIHIQFNDEIKIYDIPHLKYLEKV